MSGTSTARTLKFVGKQPEDDETIGRLSEVSQAALRQFSLERTIAYGVDYSDAIELRARVLVGEDWQAAATELAELCLAAADPASRPTRITYLRRASALLRMSQMMMLQDTNERRQVFDRAAELYGHAASLDGAAERVLIDSSGGTLAGWWISGGPEAVGSVIVFGGIEGWAMDFDVMGGAIAARGMNVLMLDAPGQGESRFAHHTYMSDGWPGVFSEVTDYVEGRSPDRPIGIVGNSMGGGVAMAATARDPRIRACCSNGGLVYPGLVPPSTGTFFRKMVAFCGTDDPDESTRIWSTVDPTVPGPNTDYPLLVVHGGRDPMISDDLAQLLLDQAPTAHKEMVVFSDGDHCVYNHRQDRDALIGDWMRSRLAHALEVD